MTFLCCMSAAAEKVQLYWNPNGSGNWASSTRWRDGNGNPIAPSGSYQIRLQGKTWATDEDKAVLEGAVEIVIPQDSSVFTISNDVDMTLAMKIYGEGSIAKYGKGELLFSMGDNEYHLLTSGSVEAYDGVVRTTATGIQRISSWIGAHAPGVFAFQPSGNVFIPGLVGDGVVSNTSASTELNLYFKATEDQRTSRDPFEFAGSFAGGKICYYGYPSHQRFTNAAMVREQFTGYLYTGYLGTMAFPPNIVVRASCEMEYLGMGETTGTGDQWLNNNTMHWKMNGGPNGGLELARWLRCNPNVSGTSDYMTIVEWSGDHTNVCSFTGALAESGSSTRATYFKKTGTGTWRFSGNRPNRGTVATEKGTLEYDSIAAAGTECSLGKASILHEEYTGTPDNGRVVPYAYLLGDGTNTVDKYTGTMSYIGTTAVVISNRPVAVKGAGRFASSTAALEWTGFTSVQAGDNTLVLAGGAADCIAWGVTNGSVGTLSVVKEGAGDWTLGADWNISGKVMAHGGKLTLATRRYTFYRLSLMENYRGLYSDLTGKDASRVWLTQLALVDGEGANQITNLAYNSAANGLVWKLKPGEAALSTTDVAFLTDAYGLENLFQDSNDGTFCAKTSVGYPQLTATGTWVRVVMRLPKASHKDIAGYDFKMRGYQSASGLHVRDPRSWMIEGSVDGRNWHELATVISNTVDTTGEDYRWLSNNSRTRDPSRPFATFDNNLNDLPRPAALEAVGVTGGAMLVSEDVIVASGIVCDAAAGGGTLKGFAFTPDAELRVENLDLSNSGTVFVPMDLSGCTGWENTAGWTLSVNGGAAHGRRFRVTAAGVRIMPKGTMLNFR